MNRTIEIIIETTGEIQIDAVGFKGPDCEKATQFLEEALGVVGKKIKKPEYHQRSTRVSLSYGSTRGVINPSHTINRIKFFGNLSIHIDCY